MVPPFAQLVRPKHNIHPLFLFSPLFHNQSFNSSCRLYVQFVLSLFLLTTRSFTLVQATIISCLGVNNYLLNYLPASFSLLFSPQKNQSDLKKKYIRSCASPAQSPVRTSHYTQNKVQSPNLTQGPALSFLQSSLLHLLPLTS